MTRKKDGSKGFKGIKIGPDDWEKAFEFMRRVTGKKELSKEMEELIKRTGRFSLPVTHLEPEVVRKGFRARKGQTTCKKEQHEKLIKRLQDAKSQMNIRSMRL